MYSDQHEVGTLYSHGKLQWCEACLQGRYTNIFCTYQLHAGNHRLVRRAQSVWPFSSKTLHTNRVSACTYGNVWTNPVKRDRHTGTKRVNPGHSYNTYRALYQVVLIVDKHYSTHPAKRSKSSLPLGERDRLIFQTEREGKFFWQAQKATFALRHDYSHRRECEKSEKGVLSDGGQTQHRSLYHRPVHPFHRCFHLRASRCGSRPSSPCCCFIFSPNLCRIRPCRQSFFGNYCYYVRQSWRGVLCGVMLYG